MFKQSLFFTTIFTAFLAVSGVAAAHPVVSNPNIKVKPRANSNIPTTPRLSPQQTGALNIISISNVADGYTSQGNVTVNGFMCPRSFLLFPEITANKGVNGKVTIRERDIGSIGGASFSATNFVRRDGSLIVQPTIRFTPDWSNLGPGYQFSFVVRVDSPAGTNWRTVKQGFYPRCTQATRRSKK